LVRRPEPKTLAKPSSKKKRARPDAKPRRGKRKPDFEDLVALQARLLAPDGCPWDREQTHGTLRTYLVEETYEVLEALESGDRQKFAEELGDLLLQIVFHSQLAAQRGEFDIGDVIEHIHTKMVRRHPHVFGETRAKDAAQVLKNWEQLKAEERGAETGRKNGSLLEGVPRTLPAVLEAYQLTRRAARIGFDWDHLDGLLEKLQEEARELRATLRKPARAKKGKRARTEEEVGDLLFVAVNVARFLGVDPEIALKKANRKFVARFQEMEREMERRGGKLADARREEMEALWDRSKEVEHKSAGKKR
jgi:tetrapyrrole methylase family protein/MazG family protein